MHAIKVVLVIGVVGLFLWAFRYRHRVGVRAGTRIAALALTVLAIASIIEPGIPQAAANALGVTRGTDLILYLLVLVFALTTTGMYFRFREYERRFTTLVRVTAIRDAVLLDGSPAANNDPPAGGGAADAAPGGPSGS